MAVVGGAVTGAEGAVVEAEARAGDAAGAAEDCEDVSGVVSSVSGASLLHPAKIMATTTIGDAKRNIRVLFSLKISSDPVIFEGETDGALWPSIYRLNAHREEILSAV